MVETLVAEIDAALLAAADPARAAGERVYLKSELQHLGSGVPATRAAVRAALERHRPLTHDEARVAARALWAEPLHERRLATVELLGRCVPVLGAGDADLLEQLLREARTWALVDPLAIGVVGRLVAEQPAGWEPVLERWSDYPGHWVRRASLLAYLPSLRAGGAFEPFAAKADVMLDEREFFIRKAIGWVLRDTGRRSPDLVAAWLVPRAARTSGVTLREALKPLSPDQREAISRAAVAGRSR